MPGDTDVIVRMENKKNRLLQYIKSGKDDPEMEALWSMFTFIEGILRSMSKRNAVSVTMKKYGVSRSWANRLVTEAMAFAGQLHRPDLDYLKMVHIESLQMDIKLAREAGQFKSLPSLYKELRLWLFPYGESNTDLEKLQVHQFNIQVNINGDNLNIPLDKFYQLKQSEVQELESAGVDEDFPSWTEIKTAMDEKENA